MTAAHKVTAQQLARVDLRRGIETLASNSVDAFVLFHVLAGGPAERELTIEYPRTGQRVANRNLPAKSCGTPIRAPRMF